MVDKLDIDIEQKEWWLDQPRECFKALKRVPVKQDQGWFEVYEIDGSTYAIYEPGHFQEVMSYLIIGDREAVILDTGLGIGNIKLVTDELTDKRVSVVNSHSHLDHVGGDYLYEDVAIYDHPIALETLHRKSESWSRYEQRVLGPGQVWKPLPPGVSPETIKIHPSEPTRLLHDGDKIDLGGRVLEVLHTPGHCPDEIVLLDREMRGLFTGDCFYMARLYAHGQFSDLDVYYETAKRLASLVPDVDWLYPSHKETKVPSAKIHEMVDAFRKLLDGTAEYEEGEMRPGRWVKNYRFDGFSILVSK